MSYWTGLVEGFQGRREAHAKEQYEKEAQNRQLADRVFTHLLQSRDPEMQQLALSGLMQPMGKKKGAAGFFGQQESTHPLIGQIASRMNEMVPDEGAAPPTAPAPSVGSGSAGMSTNVPVQGGAAPGLPGTPMPPEPPPPGEMGPSMPPELDPMGGGMGATPMPAPPPESKWKRRGTGIPTAEEIAEQNAAAGVRGRTSAIQEALAGVQAPPEMLQRAIMGVAGAPMPLDNTANGPIMADPQDPSTPIPTIRHRDGTTTLINGAPVPPTYVGYAKPSAAGQTTKTIRDPQSPSGYSAVTYAPDGTETRRVPTEFVPPPAYSGTATFSDDQGVPVRAPVLRSGGVGPALGDVPEMVPSQTLTDAKALIEIVNTRVKEERRTGLPVRPGMRDQVTREEARKLGLPFTSYAEAERASRSTPPVTRRQQTQGGSLGERLRRRALGDIPPAPAAPEP